MNTSTREILESLASGSLSVDEALLKLKTEPFDDLGYAKVDLHRKIRQGVPEVIYGAGKTPEQIIGIMKSMIAHGQDEILITRLSKEAAKLVGEVWPIHGAMPEANGIGKIVVATGGTSDLPVAEEAALTAEALSNAVVRLYDVGVAGLHRLLPHKDDIMQATVIVAVAGMEGALASVIGGLADCPVIAVPTSVGYGANFQGLSALLSMLNFCASGLSVVNIDNGFGAGYLASMINHIQK